MTPDSKVSDVEARERAEFEAAHTDCNLSRHLHYPSCYADSHVQAAWRGWQRARANQQPSAQWIAVEGVDDLPEGDWLVYLGEPLLRRHIHSATVHPNITIIGAHSVWDCPRVIAYAPLPQSPDTMRKG